MDTEEQRLERMYGELSDERLLDLREDFSNLTETARIVLVRELRSRGLAGEAHASADSAPATERHEHESGFAPGIPGVFPAGAAAVEQALEPGGAELNGMTMLISFFDGHELARAVMALRDEGIEPDVRPLAGDQLSGAPTSFEVWVESGRADDARTLLREELDLFPPSEIAGQSGVVYDDEFMTLGDFDTEAEATGVHTLLTNAGIASTLGSEPNDEGETWHTVRVKGTDLERGLDVVARGMNIR